jgi:cell division septation protein DedD
MQDDYDTMLAKISTATVAKQDAEFAAIHNNNNNNVDNGIQYSGFTNIMQDVINDGKTPQEAINAAIALASSLNIKYDEEKLEEWSRLAYSLVATTTPKPTNKPKQKVTAAEKGRADRSALPYFGEALKETDAKLKENTLKAINYPLEKTAGAVGRYFGNLFGSN